jgi:hypothetical protein
MSPTSVTWQPTMNPPQHQDYNSQPQGSWPLVHASLVGPTYAKWQPFTGLCQQTINKALVLKE